MHIINKNIENIQSTVTSFTILSKMNEVSAYLHI